MKMESPEVKFERLSERIPCKEVDRHLNLTGYHALSKSDRLRCDSMVEIHIDNVLIRGERDYLINIITETTPLVEVAALDIVASIFERKGYHVSVKPSYDGPEKGTCYRIHKWK